MGYALLWLECLALALLFTAGVAASTARFKKWKTVWPVLAAAFFLFIGVIAASFSGFLFFKNIHPKWVFPYALSWTLVLVGALWRLNRCDKGKDGEYVPLKWSENQLAFATFVALGLVWVTLDSLDNARKLEAVSFQTTALTKAQTIFKSPPPAGRDAAPYYDQAIKEIGIVPKDLWDRSTDPAEDPESTANQKLLADKANVLRLFKKGARKPHLYHPLVLSFDYALPRFSDYREANALLALEARLKARQGNIKGALKNISVMHKIGDHLLQTPTMIHSMMAAAVHVNAAKTLEVILAEWGSRGPIPVSRKFRNYDSLPQAFRDSLIFEDAVLIFMLADTLVKNPSINIFSFREDADWVTRFGNKLYRVFLMEGDLLYHQKYWNRMRELSDKPYHETQKMLKDWEQELEGDPEHGLFTAIATVSSFSNYFDRIYRGQTCLHLEDLGRAVAAYHARYKKYPLQLDVLVPEFIPEIPKDPFDGQRFRMISTGEGVVLYGVGQDQKDDGGAEWDEDAKSGDITFVLGNVFKERRLHPAQEEAAKKKAKGK